MHSTDLPSKQLTDSVTRRPTMRVGMGLLLCALLQACSMTREVVGLDTPQLLAVHYRCDHSTEFLANFTVDTVVLDSTRGQETLYLDAGGQGAGQKVFSNPRMRAEFGLGANGRQAVLHYPTKPVLVRCSRV
ncbi:hypothetical protein HC248_03449 [Polaromonas vacuolata]|uniref:C-type lysozyme inhibitor domain-containing protein n=2 Tax=Polaromonas vacuolata TaxID=37448 RepID=A0A6H2HE11_9BURK|nr:hypothetical protein HC248_03449 [Polaromonas vacuolata]